ncbi:MAG: hypothetical protein JO103_13485 [Candidatus Eremiobacteraeota bacterium]|nr:hypothetical protein [Candidatus Eremiobacteraeota bacterium]
MTATTATLPTTLAANQGRAARIGLTTARVLLGLLFLLAGASGLVMVLAHLPVPPQPGLAGAFMDVFFKSHWVLFVKATELVAGALILANRFVPLGLALLGAVLPNILFFHLSMEPSGLPVPLVLTALWAVLVARRYWAYFAPLFTARAD